MKKRVEMMDSGSSEESSKSSDEGEGKNSKKRHNSSDNSGSDRKKSPKKSRRMTHSSSSSSSVDNSEADDSGKDESSTKLVVIPPAPVETPVLASSDGNRSDLEEGQLSSESGEDESSSNSEFDDGYGDDLMGNETDRNYLEKLSEKERETELFKRAERRDQLKRRWEIERKLKQSRKNENAKNRMFKKPSIKKPKTAAAKKSIEKVQKNLVSSVIEDPITVTSHFFGTPVEEDDADKTDEYREDYFDPKERSKERKKNVEMNKTDDKRSSAMAQLKARREGKQKREVERTEQKKQNDDEKEELDGVSEKSSSVKLKARDIYSDDSDSDSEEKLSQDGRRSSSSRSSTSSDSEDGESQTAVYKKPVYISTLDELNKLRISRYKLEKFINLPIFERTVVGCFVRINIGNNSSTHKLVYRVAEITSVVETPKVYAFGSGRTNKGLKLKHGTQERVFRLEFVSNQDFTDSEYDKWKEICARCSVDMPTVDSIEHKKKDVQQALNYEFKEEDIDKIIEEKNRFRAHPTNYAMRKTQLMKERDAAILQGSEEVANEITLRLQELEERANDLDKRRSSSISLISYINNRNRKKNVEEAEKAIIEEAKANKGLKFSDPFTRRSTKPKMAFRSAQEPEDEIMIAPEIPKMSKQKERRNEEQSSSDNLYSLHDFEIDLDVALPMTNVAALPKPVDKIQDSGPKIRRSLNLEDYKKKRGLI